MVSTISSLTLISILISDHYHMCEDCVINVCIVVSKILETQTSNPNYPNLKLKYPITILDSNYKNLNLLWVV
jgi:hypothetical protein